MKIELLKILKDIFESEGIGNAFDLELTKFLEKIDEIDVPSNFTTFYKQNIKNDKIVIKK